MTTQEIEQLTAWTKPKELATKFGIRILRTGEPSETFSNLWKTRQEEMRQAGLSWRKDPKSQKWVVCWWSKLDGAEIQKREEVKQKSFVASSDFEPPRPEGLDYLPYQKAGIEYALEAFKRGNGCIIGDEMGLGKTIQAIGCINSDEEVKRVLIVCPNSLKINWRIELKKWLTRKMRIHIQMADQVYFGDHTDILIVNFQILMKFPQLAQSQWDMRIVDEAHYLKNPKAKRTVAGLSIWSRRKLHLTGTPIENKPIELFTLLNDIDPSRWKSAFTFGKRYCNATHNGFGWDFGGSSNAEELQDLLRSTIMIRRLKSQVLKELPAKRRQVIEIASEKIGPLLREEDRIWKAKETDIESIRARIEMAKANSDLVSYKAAIDSLDEIQGVAFEEMAAVRLEIGLAKVDAAIEFIEDSLEGGKVIVFCHHLDVVNQLLAKFPTAATVTGQVTDIEKRQREVERFQKDPDCRVFVGNLAAAEGLTLTAADHVIFVEGQWVPGKLQQMEDRAHRIGQKNSVLCSYLVLEGSIDCRMLRACVAKLDVIDKTLDRQHEALEYEEPPVYVPKGQIAPLNAKRDRLIKLSEKLTAEQVEEIHNGLKTIASMDWDKAREINGVGFSKVDGRIGHDLANSGRLTKMQAALGAMLCNKYRAQIGEGCWTALMKEGKSV